MITLDIIIVVRIMTMFSVKLKVAEVSYLEQLIKMKIKLKCENIIHNTYNCKNKN